LTILLSLSLSLSFIYIFFSFLLAEFHPGRLLDHLAMVHEAVTGEVRSRRIHVDLVVVEVVVVVVVVVVKLWSSAIIMSHKKT